MGWYVIFIPAASPFFVYCCPYSKKGTKTPFDYIGNFVRRQSERARSPPARRSSGLDCPRPSVRTRASHTDSSGPFRLSCMPPARCSPERMNNQSADCRTIPLPAPAARPLQCIRQCCLPRPHKPQFVRHHFLFQFCIELRTYRADAHRAGLAGKNTRIVDILRHRGQARHEGTVTLMQERQPAGRNVGPEGRHVRHAFRAHLCLHRDGFQLVCHSFFPDPVVSCQQRLSAARLLLFRLFGCLLIQSPRQPLSGHISLRICCLSPGQDHHDPASRISPRAAAYRSSCYFLRMQRFPETAPKPISTVT